ncbi:polyprenyl synthetase family protein [Paenibacillus sp. MBLB4367]|uniref:polyprenyl synthetase family protein n=1 Tax=Paenibacillus sp. MBLB4367 TaxID=3384767 RepID=UPI0039081834
MREQVRAEVYAVIDSYFKPGDLREWMKRFAADKAEERSVWSDLTLLVHRMLGGNSPHLYRIAALTEMIALAADIADDLQDKDNKEKSWMLCPPEYAWNAVLAFLVGGLAELGRLMPQENETGMPFADVCRMVAESIGGQHNDVNGSVASEQDYIQMVTDKAGALVRFACYMGYASTGSTGRETAVRMDEAACCIGIASQIRNDARDVVRFDDKSDVRRKKKTLPVFFLLEHCREELPSIAGYYEGRLSEEAFLADAESVAHSIKESGCIEYAHVIQSLYTQRAQTLLDELPALSPWKEQFCEAAMVR